MQKLWEAAPGIKALLRQANMNDLPCIMQVEQSWGEDGRAEDAKFISRLTRFPQGCFIAFDQEKQQPIATITACPAHYDVQDLGNYSNWNHATNHGFFSDDLSADNPLRNGENALYIASGIIDNNYRGADVFSHMVGAVVSCARDMKLDYVIAGAVIPGYKRYLEKYNNVSAADYVATRRGSGLADPLLSMYEKIGFHVPSSNHVIAEYFPDDASLNYAALVVHKIS